MRKLLLALVAAVGLLVGSAEAMTQTVLLNSETLVCDGFWNSVKFDPPANFRKVAAFTVSGRGGPAVFEYVLGTATSYAIPLDPFDPAGVDVGYQPYRRGEDTSALNFTETIRQDVDIPANGVLTFHYRCMDHLPLPIGSMLVTARVNIL